MLVDFEEYFFLFHNIAEENIDFSYSTTSITLEHKQRNPEACMNISIVDDSTVEYIEFFILQATVPAHSNLEGFINITNSLLVMIEDNDGETALE